MTTSPSRARWAVSAQFFTNGVLGGSFLPRFPEIKAAYSLTDTAYGFMVIAMPLGALLAATVAGPLIRRFGAARVAAGFTAAYAALLALAGFSPYAWLFAAIMLVAGASDAILDSGQNVQGMAVERWYGRSIINSLHASWSLGATAGGFIGAASAAGGVPIGWQLTAGALVWSAVAVVSAVYAHVPAQFERAVAGEAAEGVTGSPSSDGPDSLPTPAATATKNASASGDKGRARFPWTLFLPLAILAIAGALVEDVANNWVALFLSREIGVAIGVAGVGFAIMLGAQFVGRILGDPMTDRWGRSAVARFGGVLIAVGGLVAVLAPPAWAVVLGFALAGFGTATLIPAAFAAADSLPGVPHGTGVAMLGWWLRLGFLVTSPVIGVVADATGLRVALGILVMAGVLAAALAHSMDRRARAIS